MTDRLTPEQRRRCMQANRSRGTGPEQLLAHELWRRGLHYRRNVRGVSGTPDFCFKRWRVAVFVDGDFWHGRDWETAKHRIKSRRDFWWGKIERNRARDARVNAQLTRRGWQVLRFWEADVKHDLTRCADQVEASVRAAMQARLHRVYQYDMQYEEADPCAAEAEGWEREGE